MDLTPRQIVYELDKYIVGQESAKKAVAIALRNRYRRSQLPQELMEEVTPKNIIMKGPTGVGKTEIARRLAKLVKAPFIKVEATKFTEVGYVGRDVESMIRDLVECSVRLVREEQFKIVSARATAAAERIVVNALMVLLKDEKGEMADEVFRNIVLENLRNGKYDSYQIEIEVSDVPKPMELVPGSGTELNLGSIFDVLGNKKKKKRRVNVKEAMRLIIEDESNKLIDKDAVNAEAIRRAENDGIVFIDEIDKIAGKGNSSGGPDVSREGVQRDILPIVEGSTVITKYGPIKTDYILFIAAGAFHVSSVRDLIPEIQGRFPILVELTSLTKEDFINILTVPQNAIITQYKNLLRVDNVELDFTDGAIAKIAEISEQMNATSEDIGARRLHTVMENLVEDISFNAGGDHPLVQMVIDEQYVTDHMPENLKSRNLKKYIL